MADHVSNIVVSSLPDYVEQNRDKVIRKVVLGGKTISRMTPQTGIKTSAAIHYIDVEPVFQDGHGCKFTPQEGGISLTDRVIETGLIKVNMDLCPDTLLGKYAEYLVKIGASKDEFPFEQYIVEDTLAKIAKKLEKAVWQGDTDSADADLSHFDGLLKLAAGENDTVNVTVLAGTSAYDAIKAVYMAIPEEALDLGASISVGSDLYRAFLQDLVEKNLYHYSGPQNSAPESVAFPGSDVMVVKTLGLSGTKKIYASFDKNLYYGCDLENDKEDVKIWFSDDDDLFKLKVKWNSGVQTAFPDQVVIGNFAPACAPVVITQSGNDVSMACATEGATIYYTTDGHTPDENATEYSDAITIVADTTFKAIAIKDGLFNSEVKSFDAEYSEG